MRSIHPDVAALIEAARAAGAPALGSLPPAQARTAYAESRGKVQLPFEPVTAIEPVEIPAPHGPINARLYRGAPRGEPTGCLVFLHGGGWVLGTLDSHEGVCRRLAAQAGCCVLSVDYRLAPEHRFPAAVDDSATALKWLAQNATALGIDSTRLAVGGDSAGGNLAAVLALMARDASVPALTFQLLLYPVTDLSMVGAGYERRYPGMPLTGDAMRYFVDHYLGDPALANDWRASPLRAASVAGTAPAFVLTCGHDPLGDEGRRYAERLDAEGVAVTALHLSDQTHGMLTMDKAIGAARPVLDYAAAMLRDAWRAPRTARQA